MAGYPCFVLARNFFNVGICIEIYNIYQKKKKWDNLFEWILKIKIDYRMVWKSP